VPPANRIFTSMRKSRSLKALNLNGSASPSVSVHVGWYGIAWCGREPTALQVSYRLGLASEARSTGHLSFRERTLAATFSRNAFNAIKPVASDWL